jgi:excisionase family DNA binding protein
VRIVEISLDIDESENGVPNLFSTRSSADCGTIGQKEAGMTDQLHAVREAAPRLGISPWTLRRLIKAGAVRAVRVGSRRVLVSESEILKVIRRGCGAQTRPANSTEVAHASR